jgi:hypothetical protein
LGVPLTSAALAAAVAVLVGALILERRPYRPGKFNYVPVMLASVVVILILARHLLSLLFARDG